MTYRSETGRPCPPPALLIFRLISLFIALLPFRIPKRFFCAWSVPIHQAQYFSGRTRYAERSEA